jgi:hypothetical protein
MTEDEWSRCTDPNRLLDFLDGKVAVLVDQVPPHQREALRRHLLALVSPRKTRLFALACCRQIWSLLMAEASRQAVEVTEQYVEGLADYGQWRQAVNEAMSARDAIRIEPRDASQTAARVARSAAIAAMMAVRLDVRAAAEECATTAMWGALVPSLDHARAGQADLLRDIVGTPFRPPPPVEADWRAWNGGTVQRLAESIYGRRAFEEMGVLADALEEAGCHDGEILGHCRGPGPHARGCWVLDALLDKRGKLQPTGG